MTSTRSLARLAIALCGSSGCGAGTGAADIAPLPDGPSLASSEAPIAIAPASAAASAAPSPVPKPLSPFVAITALDGEYGLFPVDGALLLAAREAKPSASDNSSGNAIGYLDGDTVKFPPSMLLPGWFHYVVGIHGKWPEAISMLAVGDTGRAPTAERYTLSNQAWKAALDCRGVDCSTNRRYVGLFNVNGSLVGVEGPGMWPSTPPIFTTFQGPKVKISPKAAPATCPTELVKFKAELAFPLAATSLSDGSIVMYGTRCQGDLAVEVWKAGQAASTITKAPLAEADRTDGRARLLPSPDGGAWLVDGGIVRFDGSTWSRFDGPAVDESVTASALGKDGRLWAITQSGLYVREKRWEMIDLPGDAAASDVAVDGAGVVWVTGGGALFRERKKDEAAKPLTVAVKTQPARPAKMPVAPGSAKCKSNLVILYGFTKVTPDDYDFPLTRKAIKGHGELSGVRFVVTKDYGKKFFAGLAPTFDVAKKLSKLIEREVKGSKPGILCADPEIIRELSIDLKTGEVRK